MSDRPTAQPTRHAPGAAGDAWQLVSDAVLRGLNHELSNRAAALSGLTGMLEPHTPPGPDVAELLAREAARLEETLRLYRLLPRAAPRPAEAVLVAEALADARALHARHTGVADAPCAVAGDADALPPVIAPPRGLLHALTLLLGALALHARAAAGNVAAGTAPVLRVAGGVDVVRLVGQSAQAAAGPELPAPAAVAASATWLLEGAGTVTLIERVGVVRYAMELRPTGGGADGGAG